MTIGVTVQPHLEEATADAVLAVAATAEETDSVAALSEASRLALRAPSPAGTWHLLAEFGDVLLGYAQVWPDHAAELVVVPAARRLGVGTVLWRRAAAVGAQRLWAHGGLEAARGFAAAHRLEATRSLLKMGRPLTSEDRTPRELPRGYAAVTFADRSRSVADPVGELQALNAAAFADHPEQGRLTVADLQARMAEPWFDPQGLILVVTDDADATAVAFHWTKVEPGSTTGEVYVVGVSPDHQGRGLAGPLTDLGLAHLLERGCRAVDLYVDGENAPARATYEKAGMAVLTVDKVYAPVSAGPDTGQD